MVAPAQHSCEHTEVIEANAVFREPYFRFAKISNPCGSWSETHRNGTPAHAGFLPSKQKNSRVQRSEKPPVCFRVSQIQFSQRLFRAPRLIRRPSTLGNADEG